MSDKGLSTTAAGVAFAAERGERIFAVGLDHAGHEVVETSHALYRQTTDGTQSAPSPDESVPSDGVARWERWGWETVHRADWSAARQELTLSGPTLAPAVLRLPGGERLAALAAERVAAGRLLDTPVALADGRVVRVNARRRPGLAEPLWTVTLPGGSGNVAPDQRTDALITDAITHLRRRHGI